MARAVARLQPVGGTRVSGTVVLEQVGRQGAVELRYRLRNLPPGRHALHLHRVGDCSAADGSAAGPPFLLPESSPLAGESEPGRWDLAILRVGPSGRASGAMSEDRISLALDSDEKRMVTGRSLLIDLGGTTGTSPAVCGRPLACGVIQRVAPRARAEVGGGGSPRGEREGST